MNDVKGHGNGMKHASKGAASANVHKGKGTQHDGKNPKGAPAQGGNKF